MPYHANRQSHTVHNFNISLQRRVAFLSRFREIFGFPEIAITLPAELSEFEVMDTTVLTALTSIVKVQNFNNPETDY